MARSVGRAGPTLEEMYLCLACDVVLPAREFLPSDVLTCPECASTGVMALTRLVQRPIPAAWMSSGRSVQPDRMVPLFEVVRQVATGLQQARTVADRLLVLVDIAGRTRSGSPLRAVTGCAELLVHSLDDTLDRLVAMGTPAPSTADEHGG